MIFKTKDIPEGSERVIEGYTDADCVKVVLEMILKGPDGKAKTATHAVYPRNLQLTSEYNLAKAGEPASKPGKPSRSKGAPGAAEPAEDTKHAPKWVLGESDPKDVYVGSKWTSFLADSDDLTKIQSLRGHQLLIRAQTIQILF